MTLSVFNLVLTSLPHLSIHGFTRRLPDYTMVGVTTKVAVGVADEEEDLLVGDIHEMTYTTYDPLSRPSKGH